MVNAEGGYMADRPAEAERRVKARERQKAVLEMRLAGTTFAAIGERLASQRQRSLESTAKG